MRFNETRRYGVEIEGKGLSTSEVAAALTNAGIYCTDEGYTHRRMDHWKVVTDGSLSGYRSFELVSPPLQGEAGLEEIKRALKIVREAGGRVDQECGVHVHHDASNVGVKSMAVLGYNYSKYYPAFREMFPLSRRDNTYCRVPNAEFYRRFANHRHTGGVDGIASGNRYVAVNFRALAAHGTIEFRQHAGSLNGTKVTAWVVFTQGLIEAAIKSPRFSKRRDDPTMLRRGLFNWLQLYSEGNSEGVDAVSGKALQFIARKAGWKRTKILRAGTSSPSAVTVTQEGRRI